MLKEAKHVARLFSGWKITGKQRPQWSPVSRQFFSAGDCRRGKRQLQILTRTQRQFEIEMKNNLKDFEH